MAVVKKDSNIVGKKHNKGFEAMFVGYAKDHAMGVYRWYCCDTASIRESRDCRFLNMNYAQWKRRDQVKSIQWVDEVELVERMTSNEEMQSIAMPKTSMNQEGQVSQVTRQGREPQGIVATPRGLATESRPPSANARLIRELSRLGTSYNLDWRLQNLLKKQKKRKILRSLSWIWLKKSEV